jgi:hypothetical protein
MVVFLREALGHVPRSRPLALAALAILAAVTSSLTLIVGDRRVERRRRNGSRRSRRPPGWFSDT